MCVSNFKFFFRGLYPRTPIIKGRGGGERRGRKGRGDEGREGKGGEEREGRDG
jgi:hypothetical protein